MHQLFRGLFCGPLVLHTFSAHFTAITGAVKVATLKDEKAQSGLVLATIAVGFHPHITISHMDYTDCKNVQ